MTELRNAPSPLATYALATGVDATPTPYVVVTGADARVDTRVWLGNFGFQSSHGAFLSPPLNTSKRTRHDALRRLKDIVRAMPRIPMTAAAAEQVAAEVVQWAPSRQRVNAVVLGDEA